MFLRVFVFLLTINFLSSTEMKELTLNTGYKIPLIGLGTYLIRGTEMTNRVIDEALEAGYRLFDTAQNYNNQHFLGKAFKELLPKHNLTRNDIFITTKFEPSTIYKTEKDYEDLVREALRNLQTDYVDLFLLHWPGVSGLPNNSTDVLKYRHEAWKALSKFKKEGLIRSIGVSNFMVKHLEDLKKECEIPPVLNQVEWHPRCYNNTLYDYCKENNIVLQAYSSLGTSSSTSLRKDPTVMKIAERIGKSPVQVLLRWATQNGVPVIPKASSKNHLVENMNLDFTIPESDMGILNNFTQNMRFDWDPNNSIDKTNGLSDNILIIASDFVTNSLALPNGAPESACATMTPQHGVEPQTSESPFRIVVPKSNINGGEIIDVTIEVDPGRTFKGFFINAKTIEDEPRVVGEFLGNDQEAISYNFRNCGGTSNTATHSENELKSGITLKWKAPENYQGSIRFHATFVQERVTFWINQLSQEIVVTPLDNAGNNIYQECLRTKSCFGLPPGCLEQENCSSFGAVIVRDGTYTFEMQSSSGAGYIAMALSFDKFMGDDSAIECAIESGVIKAYASLTRAIPQDYGARRSIVNQSAINLITSRLEDGKIYCRVQRDIRLEIDGTVFSMAEQHFLLMSSGSTASPLSIGFHDINYASSTKSLLFTEDPVEITSIARKALLVLHGSFMIAAWIGLTAFGIFSARFMKKLWTGKQIFGKDVWFVIHSSSMALTWILTIIAIILIWIDVGEFKFSTHSLLGIIAASLCFIQPISAFFRPAPDDKARPIFNFMHGSVGKLAQLLAVITIFFATQMDRANLPDWTKYVLISYVVAYLIFYAMLNNLAIVSDIKAHQNSLKGAERPQSSTPPLAFPRRIIFILFSIAMLGFVITLINIFALNV
ncbi:CLUMA_CG017141, isoform A [Clunio marinus]|uniref:CLUMA_CG017141, isoform A n=1 Tax=Clunio marinus TaxID=568069 RepID=A0A1J1IV12_9DIPT|nr:CLUMA_CG017141, isoform A [Clunio marinus]